VDVAGARIAPTSGSSRTANPKAVAAPREKDHLAGGDGL